MAWTQRYDGAEPQRINKWLAQSGVCSRREAEALIAQGLVRIDGAVVADPGHKIAAGQTLAVADTGDAPISVVIHKPVGVVSAQPERGQIPAARLLTTANLWGDDAPIPETTRSLPPLAAPHPPSPKARFTRWTSLKTATMTCCATAT